VARRGVLMHLPLYTLPLYTLPLEMSTFEDWEKCDSERRSNECNCQSNLSFVCIIRKRERERERERKTEREGERIRCAWGGNKCILNVYV